MSFVLKTRGKNSQVVSLSLTCWIWSFIHSLCYEYKSTLSDLEILLWGHTPCWMLMYQSFSGDFP